MISYIDEFFRDPKGMLIFFLLAFPGRVLALSLHEFAHAWVAHRCGDDTAKLMGRMTVNPMKHLDPLGTVLMLVVGFGWAKPVPVNPRNYRNYRKDDLKVSLAGVTMNAIMFLLSFLVMSIIAAFAWNRIPTSPLILPGIKVFRTVYDGSNVLMRATNGQQYEYYTLSALFHNLPYVAADDLITPAFGTLIGYLYQMLSLFCITNLMLCIFNLLPIPPLDGYHVLNDLVLRRRQLFANPRTAQIASSALFILVLTGVVGRVLGWVDTQILTGVGNLAIAALRGFGLIA